jgi:hypothetical protein
MNANYATTEIAATPEYVLELLRDVFRGWNWPDDFPTFDTSVSDFAMAWNDTFWSWQELSCVLNDLTRLDLPQNEWEPVLSPMDERTVGGACRFVAGRLRTRPVIRPWPHVTGECLPAGAFLTARSLLAQLGADARAVTPSAPLREYLERFGPGWVLDLMWMAPGRLPPVEVRYALQSCAWACAALGLGLLLIGRVCTTEAVVFGCSGALFLAATIAIGLLNRLLPYRILLGELSTFRDLAYALAGQQPQREIQLTA